MFTTINSFWKSFLKFSIFRASHITEKIFRYFKAVAYKFKKVCL